jgi:hypothetical protein
MTGPAAKLLSRQPPWGEHPIVCRYVLCDFNGAQQKADPHRAAIDSNVAKGRYMTRIQFEQSRIAIEQEPFESNSCNPITYGIDRNTFRREKLQRLIDLARKAPGRIANTKLKIWQQQLDRSIAAKERFEKLRTEMKMSRLSPLPGELQRTAAGQSPELTRPVSGQRLSAD